MNKRICSSLPIVSYFWLIVMCRHFESQSLHLTPFYHPRCWDHSGDICGDRAKESILDINVRWDHKEIGGPNTQGASVREIPRCAVGKVALHVEEPQAVVCVAGSMSSRSEVLGVQQGSTCSLRPENRLHHSVLLLPFTPR